ncbi:hypothetical protein GCM10011609_49410 [Lentzea pudingi]|uniref:Carbohydrate kinase PfkB domain-containing protein n=1 Tax=Lentzea pudingi TaxID=1789439 RepID=A0ABQ2ID44_9PSEU|nr:hypothetical protein GCM10011609_49410 [Lentzea pudingi]
MSHARRRVTLVAADPLLSRCDKAFAHSASAAVRRDFLLVLNFAQDEDLVANIRDRRGRVHLHHGGPAANQAWCCAETGDRVPRRRCWGVRTPAT